MCRKVNFFVVLIYYCYSFKRVQKRKNHATLGPDKAVEVITRFNEGKKESAFVKNLYYHSFWQGFKPPEDWELGGGTKYELMLQTSKDKDFAEQIVQLLKKD